jgi:hypothetical protein
MYVYVHIYMNTCVCVCLCDSIAALLVDNLFEAQGDVCLSGHREEGPACHSFDDALPRLPREPLLLGPSSADALVHGQALQQGKHPVALSTEIHISARYFE